MPGREPRKPAVIVVDDDPAARLLARKWLEADYEVLEAETSHLALRILTEREDIVHVLTDSNMPEFDGIDLCRTVRSAYGDTISVVFVTAAGADPVMQARICRAKGNAIVSKPYSGYELRRALNAVIPIVPARTSAFDRRKRAHEERFQRICLGIHSARQQRLVSMEGEPVTED